MFFNASSFHSIPQLPQSAFWHLLAILLTLAPGSSVGEQHSGDSDSYVNSTVLNTVAINDTNRNNDAIWANAAKTTTGGGI